MENIKHQTLPVNGINLHVAEIGEGPTVLFLHGFPELWYSWRHQMLYLASKGYRAIAPDLRGYGDSDALAGATNYTAFHIVGDLVALLNRLGLDKVFLVGHDWGAVIAWYFCLFRPDRIKALVNFSCAFRYFDPKDPAKKPVAEMREMFGDDFYVCRFQAPGEVEEELAGVDMAAFMKACFLNRESGIFCIPKGAFGYIDQADSAQASADTDWLTQEDIDYFAAKHSKNGLTGGINFYRAIDQNWELSGAWVGSKIQVPVRFVVGDVDSTYHMPGMKEYLHNGGFKKDVPNLEKVVVVEGAAHYINQEKPDVCSTQIYEFISKF